MCYALSPIFPARVRSSIFRGFHRSSAPSFAIARKFFFALLPAVHNSQPRTPRAARTEALYQYDLQKPQTSCINLLRFDKYRPVTVHPNPKLGNPKPDTLPHSARHQSVLFPITLVHRRTHRASATERASSPARSLSRWLRLLHAAGTHRCAIQHRTSSNLITNSAPLPLLYLSWLALEVDLRPQTKKER
jgi:hypothetical protein